VKSFHEQKEVLSYDHDDCSPIGMIPSPILLGRFNDTLWSLTSIVLGKADVTHGNLLKGLVIFCRS